MISDNRLGVEPPKDANGKAIPLDTETLYSTNGQVFHVNNIKYVTKKKRWETYGYFERDFGFWEGCTNDLLLAPPDSWDKLIDDLRNAAERDIATCAYLSPEGKGCTKCQAKATRECTRTAFTDILSRIERLRGANND